MIELLLVLAIVAVALLAAVRGAASSSTPVLVPVRVRTERTRRR